MDMERKPVDPHKFGHLKAWTVISLVVTVPMALFCLLFLVIVAPEGFTIVAFLLLLSLWLVVSQTVSLFLLRRLLRDLTSESPKPPKVPPQNLNMDLRE